MNDFLFNSNEWNFETIEKIYDACEKIAVEELKLDTYKNQLEIISSEQMLDAYASNGLPILYKHWSFGKHFLAEESQYRKGNRGLAYEIIINSNPCISYLMEENSMTTQAAVIAHAAFGHNHFFKNNYLFKQWTDASHIIDYLTFARNYIRNCEEKYGFKKVEKLLDYCHSIASYGVNKYERPVKLNVVEEKEKQKEREEYLERHYNDLWRTLPKKEEKIEKEKSDIILAQPEENILYFLEKNSPILEMWQREILRIVRKIHQYFYPQYQTKMMNEGFACNTHFYIMNRLYDKKLISEGTMLEFLKMHSSVIYQPEFSSKYYSGLNPYYVGFEIFKDIRRICENPTDEDKEWFPELVGKNWVEAINYAAANYRDESFVRQFLSPHLIRKFKLFTVKNDTSSPYYEVKNIHNKTGYKYIKDTLAKNYEISNFIPDIQVVAVDLKGDRTLTLEHKRLNGIKLKDKEAGETLKCIGELWGYRVKLISK